MNYTLIGISIHPVTTKIQASFLTQLPERKETAQGFHHEASGDFKTVAELNGCDRRKLMMDHQHCSYSTILTYLSEKRKPLENKTIPKHASCLKQGTQVILQKYWGQI
jgi:hypothetical protein